MTIPPTPSFIVDFQFRANLQRLNRITQSIRGAERMISVLMGRIRRAMSRVNDEQNNFNNNSRNTRRNSRSMANDLIALASSATRVAAAFSAVGYAAIKMGTSITSTVMDFRNYGEATNESGADLFALDLAMRRARISNEARKNVMDVASNTISAVMHNIFPKDKVITLRGIGISTEEILAGMTTYELVKRMVVGLSREKSRSRAIAIARSLGLDPSIARLNEKEIDNILAAGATPEDIINYENAIAKADEFNRALGELSASWEELKVSLIGLVPVLQKVVEFMTFLTNISSNFLNGTKTTVFTKETTGLPDFANSSAENHVLGGGVSQPIVDLVSNQLQRFLNWLGIETMPTNQSSYTEINDNSTKTIIVKDPEEAADVANRIEGMPSKYESDLQTAMQQVGSGVGAGA